MAWKLQPGAAMIKQNVYTPEETTLLSEEPLTYLQLSLIADEILSELIRYRPEFANLARLQRSAGCRIQELFQPNRWQIVSQSVVQVQPQKGNALRVLQLSDIGYSNADNFAPTLADMARLPNRQYERAFSFVVGQKGLWRLYEDGFARPSTHLFRHVKIKELSSQGFDKAYIATWIGEKNVDNLDYYLNSQYFV